MTQVRHRCMPAEREGVEPSRLVARPFSGRLPSPVGLPFRLLRSLTLPAHQKESTQRELNPHVLHGKQAGCRYITGAPIPLGPEGVEPSSGPYKEPALAVELRAR